MGNLSWTFKITEGILLHAKIHIHDHMSSRKSKTMTPHHQGTPALLPTPDPEQQHGPSCRNAYCPSVNAQSSRETTNPHHTGKHGNAHTGMKLAGTNTIFFVKKQDVPNIRQKDVIYGRIVCNYQPGKAESNRTKLTMRGDRINYPNGCGTPTADLLTVKLLLNSVISTKGAKFMMMDIKRIFSAPCSTGMNTSDSSWRMYCQVWQSNTS